MTTKEKSTTTRKTSTRKKTSSKESTADSKSDSKASKTSKSTKSTKSSTGRTSKPRTSRSSTRSSSTRTSRSKPAAESVPESKAAESQSPTSGNTQHQWYKADLHLHTMASHDYEQPDVTYLEWMRRAAEQELDIVAVTDHNTVAGIGAIRKEVEWLTRLEEEGRLTKDETTQLAEWRELGEKVLLLPGFEFTATFGFHILGIFPPDTPTRTLELLLLQLGVPPEKLDEGSTETGATTDVREAYRIIREAGGLVIAAHANSTHGVAMRDFPFGGQTKIAYTQDPNLDALEVTDLAKRGRSTARFFNGTKAEYPRRMHCIQGSDAHCIVKNPKKPKRLGIGERATDLSLTEPTFEAIATLFRGDEFNRTRMARPKDQPYDAVENARDEGPGIALSFHASASARGGKLAAILSDICAFGNTVGGAVFVGADHKKTKPKGLTKPEDTLAEIKEALTERVTPPIDLKYEICETQGQKVLQIVVPKGKDRPYCLDEYKFYVRDEADTHQAVRDEIFALVKSVLDEQNSQSGNSRNGGSNGGGSNGGGSSSNNRRGRRGGRGRGRRSGSDTGANGGERSNSGSNGNNSGEGSDDAFHLPQIGVEVVESVQRNSHQVHSIRDMRNGNVVKNITRKGSRKLWNYAIQSHEDKVVEKAKIEWKGDIGLINVDKRAGKVRYDLALRESGATRVFYGVTEDGMEGRWSAFIQDD